MVTEYKQIRIDMETSNRLDKLKIMPEESYNHLIKRLLDKTR